jgi:hypothetical protein
VDCDGERIVNDLEYRIKTVSDVEPLQKNRRELEQSIKACKQYGVESAALTKELEKVDRALQSQAGRAAAAAKEMNQAIAAISKSGGSPAAIIAERNAILKQTGIKAPSALGTAASTFLESGGGAGGLMAAGRTLGAGAGVAIGAATISISATAKALQEYATAEERIVRLEAAMSEHGLLSDENRSKFQDLAGDLEKMTAIAKGDWISVLQRLVQFGANGGNIQDAAEGVKNLAGIMDGDLQSAALSVGKALSGNFEGFTRLGIEFDEHMSQAQKLQKLWVELAQRGGGQLEAQADTLAGSFRRLKNGVSDIFETYGGFIARSNGLKEIMYGLGTSISWLADKLNFAGPKADELTNSTHGVAKAMESAEAATKAQTKALTDYLAKLDELASRDKAEVDAKADRDAALIDKQLKDGKITPQQAAIAKAKIVDDKEKTKALIDTDVRDKTIQKLDEQIAENNQLVQKKQQDVENSRRAVRMAKSALGDRPNDPVVQEMLKKAEDELAARSQGFNDTRKTVGDENYQKIQQRESIRANQSSADRVLQYQSETRRAQLDYGQPGEPSGPTMDNAIFAHRLPRNEQGLGAVQTHLQNTMQYYEASAAVLSRMGTLTESQSRQLQEFLARMSDIERKMQIVESQIRNAPSR